MMCKNAKETFLKIDFGSGYGLRPGFKSCDFTGSPILDFLSKDYKIFKDIDLEIENGSVDEFFVRNVIHHIKDLRRLFKMFFKYLKVNGRLTIIDCRKEFYSQNVFLDTLWYRGIIPRYEVWFSDHYRDYASIAKEIGFTLNEHYNENEKEVFIFSK